jgi:hypothetical protein
MGGSSITGWPYLLTVLAALPLLVGGGVAGTGSALVPEQVENRVGHHRDEPCDDQRQQDSIPGTESHGASAPRR